MPTLHKNITASADIHNPKWFPDANNGDVAWRNEKGELESTDELVLPAALNFVDASVAPPTTNDGDIYVLSSGGSVHVDWGAVSLDDWVRYDGSAWNSITPQKSSLCYDKTTDALFSYDGTDWAQVGVDSIYTASGTVPTSVVATLTDTLTFSGGSGTEFNIYSTLRADDIFTVLTNGGGSWKAKNGNIDIGDGSTYSNYYTRFSETGIKSYGAGSVVHEINNVTGKVYFMNGYMSGQDFIIGSNSVIGSEEISLQGRTLVQGAGTAGTNIAFEVYDSDTTPATKFEIRSNGDIYTNGTQGLSNTYTFGGGSTGDIASMTFTNGILTAVTTVP
jgi:hypothetical protein